MLKAGRLLQRFPRCEADKGLVEYYDKRVKTDE